MTTTTMHREDVKASLRKRYASVEAFAVAHGIKGQAVRDTLRGKARGAIGAIAKELGVNPDQLQISQGPVCGIDSSASSAAHCLNGGKQ